MNCAGLQEKIALFSGGDLGANEVATVQAHLAACAECRDFEQSLSEMRAMLLSLRAVDEDQVTAVRSGVLRQLQERRSPVVLAWLPYAAAVATLVFGVALWHSRIEPPVRVAHLAPPAAAVVEAPVVPTLEKKVLPAKRVPRVRPNSAPVPIRAEQAEPTVVTLYTDDPDVVIVWITD